MQRLRGWSYMMMRQFQDVRQCRPAAAADRYVYALSVIWNNVNSYKCINRYLIAFDNAGCRQGDSYRLTSRWMFAKTWRILKT